MHRTNTEHMRCLEASILPDWRECFRESTLLVKCVMRTPVLLEVLFVPRYNLVCDWGSVGAHYLLLCPDMRTLFTVTWPWVLHHRRVCEVLRDSTLITNGQYSGLLTGHLLCDFKEDSHYLYDIGYCKLKLLSLTNK